MSFLPNPSIPADPVSRIVQDDIFEEQEQYSLVDEDEEVPCKFITGAAGTGKTFSLRKEIERDPKAGILCATTGVAAVNLDTVTINGILRYFDTASLTDLYISGRLVQRLEQLAKAVRAIYLDECSMLDADQLDVLYQAIKECNARNPKKKLGLTLTGDFCQLAPVKAKYAFQAQCWPAFAKNIVRLTKVYRQDNPEFLAALNLARQGKGIEAAEALRGLAKWSVATNVEFEGTTVYGRNSEVDRHNLTRYMRLKGKEVILPSSRRGKQLKEWEKQIPPSIRLKDGAYVMILTNAKHSDNEPLEYANGDCGWVRGVEGNYVLVELKRNKKVVKISRIERFNESRVPVSMQDEMECLKYGMKPYFDSIRNRWILGEIVYLPLRLAFATSVHKSQGLTIDAIQIDIRDHFFGSSNMGYTALSRVRTPEGLTIIGSPELLARRINIAPEVVEWI